MAAIRQMFTIATGVSSVNCREIVITIAVHLSPPASKQAWHLDWYQPRSSFQSLTNDNGADQSIFSDPAHQAVPMKQIPISSVMTGSPCIDAGKTGFTPFSGEVDYDGQSRGQRGES